MSDLENPRVLISIEIEDFFFSRLLARTVKFFLPLKRLTFTEHRCFKKIQTITMKIIPKKNQWLEC